LPEIIRALIDRQKTSEPSVLPEALRVAYGGDLRFPTSGLQRPYVIGSGQASSTPIIPYGVSDHTTRFATVQLDELLAAMQ
jgi:hypothetical protein